jgi:2-amino-4-hydroxy-6-hydroxymethyldihydropteridine diphosphokinase
VIQQIAPCRRVRGVAFSLGSNLGSSKEILRAAVNELRALHDGAGEALCSSLYETEPWGRRDQPRFLNIAFIVQTSLDAQRILAVTQAIETNHGRVRHEHLGARTLDIDILLCGDEVVETSTLSIPHPRLHQRRFVLLPLQEIAPQWQHPVLHKSVGQLAAEVDDPCSAVRVGELPRGAGR